jgi:hypothetical protein
MAKLIGTAPNQVPTNADLGSLAYMDKDNFDANISELTLGALSREITDTAVDIFVYDTRKDSDGGAWRKRTQHTSWYNEEASATRGSRKEFPAVAVIVADSSRNVTIYDGDDPDLPMWMVFNSGAGTWIICTTGNLSLSMLNGLMSITCDGANQRFRTIDFIKERHREYSHTDGQYSLPTGIVTRNSAINGSYESGTVGLINRTTIDVAMTVLPNAPIDAATGLPVPTIAVATGSGTSIIRDDGTVVDYTLGNYTIVNVDFDYDNNVLQTSRNIGSGGGALYVNKFPILSADNASGNIQQELVLSSTAGDNTSSLDFIRTPFIEGTKNLVGMKDSTLAFSSDAGAVQGIGVYQLGPDGTTKTTTLGAVISSDYNTGWMNGQIKLATLSDTDDTDVTGSELVDNGNFNNGGDWSFGGGWNFANGQAEIDTTNNDLLSQDIGMVSGKTYTVSLVMTEYTDGVLDVRLGGNATQTATGTGVKTFTGVAGGSTLQIYAFTNATLSIDDISVRLAEEDRSVNGNGLQVFGTVTKNPVATGADLVAYSGFSSSNYLQQPYNSDLDFGTGVICVNVWAKHVHTGGALAYYIFDKADTDGTNRCGAYYIPNTGVLDFYTPSGTARANNVSLNNWSMITLVRSGTISYVYINGELKGTQTSVTEDLTSSDQTGTFVIGTRFNGSEPWQVGDLSLLRISATAPSPEQIKKIYEDEKVLFQENAQATLYGSSDAVTALAYDDSTELLHVGTSAGRSVFQGLRRVDNTTTAVGAAISASNGLVADE